MSASKPQCICVGASPPLTHFPNSKTHPGTIARSLAVRLVMIGKRVPTKEVISTANIAPTCTKSACFDSRQRTLSAILSVSLTAPHLLAGSAIGLSTDISSYALVYAMEKSGQMNESLIPSNSV
jgi:hypothetical protein